MDRVIVHLDADAFFASVEQSADPRLRGKPIAVGGEKRGIIASASYEARKFGIYTPMPTVQARRLCPRLIVLPGDFERYEQFSRWMFSYPQDFTPDVEITSIDEGYFDLSANPKPARDVAATVRKAIRQSLKITVSEGIASNKLVSQIASKLNKPDAFQEVPTGTETHFLAPLPNRWLPGIGPKTSARLNAAGLALVSHVAATPVDLLELLVGNQAPTLRQFARGIDTRPLVPARDPAKSFGTQQTFAADVTDEEFIDATLRRMADDLFARVRAEASVPSPSRFATTTWPRINPASVSANPPHSKPMSTDASARCCARPGGGASACAWFPSSCPMSTTAASAPIFHSKRPLANDPPANASP